MLNHWLSDRAMRNENKVRPFLNKIVVDDIGYDEVYDMVTDSRNCTDFWEAVSEMYEGDW